MGRTREELNAKKIIAEQEYLKGEKSLSQIARDVKVNFRTIHRWDKRHEWSKKKQEIAKKVRDRMHIDVTEEKERTLKIIHAIESKYVNELREAEKIPNSTGAFSQVQRVKWDILLPRNANQYNFTKEENTGFKLIIERPDERSKVEAKQKAIPGV